MTTSPGTTLAAPASTRSATQASTRPTASLAVQVLSLTEALAGFPGHRDYALVAADGTGLLFWLQSLAPEGPRFLAVPAGPFFPDYTPALPRAVCAEIGIEDDDAADVYCLVSVPGGDVPAATANLRAPVVVNPATHQARQVVLLDGAHPIRRPLRR